MHALEEVMRQADGFLLVGDSSEDRFPGFSYHAYTRAGRRFYCLDLGGLTESRGPTTGGKVYASVDELPPGEVGDLAIVWVKPRRAALAVEHAHAAGCTRVWFSFFSAHPAAIDRANELGMQVVEVGRCPVYYLEDAPLACRCHTAVARISGTRGRAPQTTLDKAKRIMW
jgi:hypothetical protein